MEARGSSSKVEENVFDEAGEGEVGHPEVEADDRDRDDHDDGRREELPAAGPFDLLELSDRLGREAAETAAAFTPGTGLALGLADRLNLAPARASAIRRAGRLLELTAAAGAR
jgi:hypothetical protein